MISSQKKHSRTGSLSHRSLSNARSYKELYDLKDTKIKSAAEEKHPLLNSRTDQSGSCACLTVVHEDKLYIGNVGDSRVLLGTKNSVKQLTTDHKPMNPSETKRIVKAGA